MNAELILKKIRGHRLPGKFLLFAILAITLPLDSGEATSAECKSVLCDLTAAGRLPELRWPDYSDYRIQVQNCYETTGYTLAWMNGGVLTEQAKALVQALKDADAKGLNPDDYDGSRWADRVNWLNQAGKSASETDLARFDLALTVSVMRYVSALRFGRVNPALFRGSSQLRDEQHELANFIRQQLVSAGRARCFVFSGGAAS